MHRLKEAMLLLIANDAPLGPEWLDHPLKGEWKPDRDLHIEPDWILIYTVEADTVRFERTGTHADIFGK